MGKYWNHFKTITKHRWIVFLNCAHCGYFWRGLVHDLSKYSIIEFCSSARYFQGNRSPINAEKEDKGYSLAWQHHKGHNPHHWEYWIDNLGTYKNNPVKIPYKYVVEMICDWIAAGKTYSKEKWTIKEPLEYYTKVKDTIILHEQTRNLIEQFLKEIAMTDLEGFYLMAKRKEVKDKYEV